MPASVLSVSRFRRASRGGAFGVPFAAPACQRKPGHCWPGLGVWWTEGGSNSRPPHCERGALPAELSARETRNYSRCLGVWEGGVEQRMTQRAQRDWRERGGRRCAKQRFARRSRKPRQRRRGVVETSPSSPRRRPTGDFRERQTKRCFVCLSPADEPPQGGRGPLGGQRVTDAKRLARTWGAKVCKATLCAP